MNVFEFKQFDNLNLRATLEKIFRYKFRFQKEVSSVFFNSNSSNCLSTHCTMLHKIKCKHCWINPLEDRIHYQTRHMSNRKAITTKILFEIKFIVWASGVRSIVFLVVSLNVFNGIGFLFVFFIVFHLKLEFSNSKKAALRAIQFFFCSKQIEFVSTHFFYFLLLASFVHNAESHK